MELIIKTSGKSIYLYEPGSFNWIYQVHERKRKYKGGEDIEYLLEDETGKRIENPEVIKNLIVGLHK